MSIDSISDTIERALVSAGLNPRAGVLKNVTASIRRSLAGIGSDLEARRPRPEPGEGPARPPAGDRTLVPGSFTSHRFKGPAGSRTYKLYVPTTVTPRPLPLIVMLHGCKQNPDDFAAGTRMNDLAERHGFLVAYPAQSRNANGSNCWNWFQPTDQQRDQGEPSIIAGIVADVMTLRPIDPARVFVAGLSAGAAMAVILGATYPDVFKAVGVHSGLALGAAHDVASAFGAMHGGARGRTLAANGSGVPTIVFQGDQDATVVAANADAVIRQSVGAVDGARTSARATPGAPGTRAHTTTRYVDLQGQTQAEKWMIRGGAHAWSGGSANGSYTESDGPDASVEMVRFFLDRG